MTDAGTGRGWAEGGVEGGGERGVGGEEGGDFFVVGVHLEGVADGGEGLVTDAGLGAVPGVVGAPGEVEERHGVARAGQAVDAEAERAGIGEGVGGLVAVGAGLGAVAGEAFVEEEAATELDALDGERVVGGQGDLGKAGGDDEGKRRAASLRMTNV